MKSILMGLVLAFLGMSTIGQANQTPKSEPEDQEGSSIQRQIVDLPLPKRSFRPKLSLQRALKLAEKYIDKKKINISSYYLYEAKYILYGGEENKEPAWFFWWINENGSMGDYVQIVVSINTGKIKQIPSM